MLCNNKKRGGKARYGSDSLVDFTGCLIIIGNHYDGAVYHLVLGAGVGICCVSSRM